MSRYQILIADPLLQMGLQFPPGTGLVEQLEVGHAGTHWWSFEDAEAPAGLEGKRVELTLQRVQDDPDAPPVPRIASRRLIVTHLAPQDDSGLMPCCDVPAWEKPGADGITGEKELVTCAAADAPAGPAVPVAAAVPALDGLERLRAVASGGAP